MHDAFLPNGNMELDDGEAEEGELEEGEAAEETKDVAMPEAVAEGMLLIDSSFPTGSKPALR